MVFLGFVRSWSFAAPPTRNSPRSASATTLGRMRFPLSVGTTRGMRLRTCATHVFVVPRSIPMMGLSRPAVADIAHLLAQGPTRFPFPSRAWMWARGRHLPPLRPRRTGGRPVRAGPRGPRPAAPGRGRTAATARAPTRRPVEAPLRKERARRPRRVRRCRRRRPDREFPRRARGAPWRAREASAAGSAVGPPPSSSCQRSHTARSPGSSSRKREALSTTRSRSRGAATTG